MKQLLSVLSLLLAAGFVHAQDAVKRDQPQMHRLHDDPKAYMKSLDDPKRDEYQKPHDVLTALNIKPGEVIADVGAGSGYFTFRLAHFVGDKGKVFAVDVSPDMVRHVNRRIRETKTTNVVTILADNDDPLLPDRSVNRFFICDVWHHVENQTKYLSLMKKMLKPGGEIVMIDFHKKELPFGPPPQMKIAREDLIKQMEANGFKKTREHTFLPYQYFLVFAPK
jgi:cyclopropane fatty-acyl-phospholipid synthase-like methyltransferase